MDKIKIAHIITELERGGAQFNTLFTVKNLPAEKYKRILITNTRGVLNNEAYRLNDVNRIFLGSLGRELNLRKDIQTFLEIFRILKKEKPHIVHTHSSKAGLLGRWAAYFAKVPIIIHTVHGFGFWYFSNKLIRRFFIFLERITAMITSTLVVVSTKDMKVGLSKKIGNSFKYEIIRSGIDIKEIKNTNINRDQILSELGIRNNEFIVLKIAPFKKQKAPLNFIRLASEVITKKQDFPIKFVLIGGGELEQEIKNEIEKLHLEDHVILAGWKENPIPYFKAADVFILTSEWEGLPRTFLEAMACQKPIIATNVGGAEDVIKNEVNGFLVPFGNIKIMADRLIYLIENDEIRKNMAEESGRLLSDEFDINVMVRQLDNLYHRKITGLNA
ncbi:MAG: glycosyltransferase family 4 protein [bacterium]|nr:glycosyltransferase family 4 protein [bacterium]